MKTVKLLLVLLMVTGMFIVGGCSNSPSSEEKTKLDNLKSEVSQLEKDVRSKQDEKASFARLINEKNAKLKQCQSDQDAVKKAMGK